MGQAVFLRDQTEVGPLFLVLSSSVHESRQGLMKYAVQLFERSFKPRRVSSSCIVYRPSMIRVLYVKRNYLEYRVQIIIICRRVRHVIYRYAVKFSSRQDESRSRMTDVVPELSANHDRTCSITRVYVNNLVPILVILLHLFLFPCSCSFNSLSYFSYTARPNLTLLQRDKHNKIFILIPANSRLVESL